MEWTGLRERWTELQGWHERLAVVLGGLGAASLFLVAMSPLWALIRFLFVAPQGGEPGFATAIATSLAVVALLALGAIEVLVVAAVYGALGRRPLGFAGLATVFVMAAALIGSHTHLPLPVSAPLAAITSLGALCSVWSLLTTLRSPRPRRYSQEPMVTLEE